jgi:hypothetical protein
VLAEVTGAPAARLAPFAFPALLPPPDLEAGRERALVTAGTLRWRTSRAAVVRDGVATAIRRPVLLEVTRPDGQRLLLTWPPPAVADDQPVESRSRAPGPTTVLPAPAAAAVLARLFGPRGDALLAGGSPRAPLRYAGRAAAARPDESTRSICPARSTSTEEGTEQPAARCAPASWSARSVTRPVPPRSARRQR